MPEYAPIVPPELPTGTPPCLIAFVGEAPAHTEGQRLKPLTGHSGYEFDKWLEAARLPRSRCLIANVFPSKLENNDVASICGPASPHCNLPPVLPGKYLLPEQEHHVFELRSLLTHWHPAIIVPLGATALWAITGQTGIKRLAGHLFEHNGQYILPAYHPAHILRGNYHLRAQTIANIVRAASLARESFSQDGHHRPIVTRPRHAYMTETVADVEQALRICSRHLTAVDIETIHDAGIVTCIGFSAHPEKSFTVPLYHPGRHRNAFWHPGDHLKVVKLIRDFLENPAQPVVFHRGIYDIWWLWKFLGIRTCAEMEDTAIMHHVLWCELPKDLNTLGAQFTDMGPWKSKGAVGKRDDA